MATPHTPQSIDSRQSSRDFDEKEAIPLERVAEQLVRFEQQVGVTRKR